MVCLTLICLSWFAQACDLMWRRGVMNSRWADPCCSPCTSQRRRCRCSEPPWSREKQRRRWWQRTRRMKSSRQSGRRALCCHSYRWGRQSTPDGVWQEKEALGFERPEQVFSLKGFLKKYELMAVMLMDCVGFTDLKGYSNSTSMLRSLSVRFLHSTAMRNIPE